MKLKLMVVSVLVFLTSCGVVDKEGQKIFFARSGPFEVTVYPVHVVISETTQADTSLQMQLIRYLNQSGMAKAVASERDIAIPFTWGANQAKMFRRSATSFAAAIQLDKPATPYALLVETLSIGIEENMGGVHFYLVDSTGKVVAGSLSNSHWEAFKSISPKGRNEGMKVAYRLLNSLTIETP